MDSRGSCNPAGQITGIGGECVDVSGSNTANGTGAQTWQAQSNGTVRNPQSGRCLDAKDSSSADGTRLIIWDCFATANQIWRMPG
ncbi:RICIN domain-containing protein [Kibdelosporangium aridum]|uniref:RICIN domain-containing protein n=1 Tax=Kibdelosporangium aridum TaxID=2030 RepID=UPI0035EFF985